jgi:hypothetical protein
MKKQAYTVWVHGSQVGTLHGPYQRMLYPWIFEWESSHGEHQFVFWADDPNPALAAVVTCLAITNRLEPESSN